MKLQRLLNSRNGKWNVLFKFLKLGFPIDEKQIRNLFFNLQII